MKRLDQFAASTEDTRLVIVMDEHEDRSHILTEASRAMFGWQERRNIIEPPFEVESRRYQTCQCADWLCGLFGRLAAYRIAPSDFGDLEWAERYFGQRISQTQTRSSIRRASSLSTE